MWKYKISKGTQCWLGRCTNPHFPLLTTEFVTEREVIYDEADMDTASKGYGHNFLTFRLPPNSRDVVTIRVRTLDIRAIT